MSGLWFSCWQAYLFLFESKRRGFYQRYIKPIFLSHAAVNNHAMECSFYFLKLGNCMNVCHHLSLSVNLSDSNLRKPPWYELLCVLIASDHKVMKFIRNIVSTISLKMFTIMTLHERINSLFAETRK